MELKPFDKDNEAHVEIFLQLLISYFAELFADDPDNQVPDNRMPEVLDDIINELKCGLFWVYFCCLDDKVIGFIMAQIDTPGKSWYKREGWGFIRELFVLPSHRRNGYASQMSLFMEDIFSKNNASNVYLTAEDNHLFWKKMGYIESAEIDDFMNQKIYEKKLKS